MNTPPLTRQQRHRQRTRDQLIRAAVELTLEKGYDAVTVQDITDRADLGRGTFYIHFKEKEDVLWTAIQVGLQETEAMAHTQFKDGALPAKLEYYYYLNIFHHAERNQALYRVMLGSQGSSTIKARVQSYFVSEFERDISMLPKQLFSGFGIPKDVLAQVVMGAVMQVMLWWLETPNPYSPEQMAGLLYEALHHKKPPEAARRLGNKDKSDIMAISS